MIWGTRVCFVAGKLGYSWFECLRTMLTIFVNYTSMWTPEQAAEIQNLAQELRPGVKTYSIPYGLKVERGPDATVEHLVENVPPLLDSME